MAGMPYPPNQCASVPICGRLSLPEGSVCSACSVGHSLPVCLFMSVVVFSHGIHGIHGMLGCVIGGVGMAGCHTLLICAHLCLSVGGTSLPECSVCSAYSVGTLYLFALLVLQRQLHQRGSILPRNPRNTQNVRLRYWRRGYGRMPYPPNLCTSVSICGRHFSARMFCVFCVFCGNTLSVCFVGAAEAAAPAW